MVLQRHEIRGLVRSRFWYFVTNKIKSGTSARSKCMSLNRDFRNSRLGIRGTYYSRFRNLLRHKLPRNFEMWKCKNSRRASAAETMHSDSSRVQHHFQFKSEANISKSGNRATFERNHLSTLCRAAIHENTRWNQLLLQNHHHHTITITITTCLFAQDTSQG